ncbi:uncharacterized protein LOC135280657 isoform X1 [Passer domesticus]|uniref:uncharacterized protein LOC135280657 isoform X1 n=2 Tax=Passer domesticus TaxID=48849 RepID=UPI0030FE8745
MSAPPGICSSLHLKHSTKFHPLLLQQVLVTQFLLTAEEEAQVSSENEQLEGWGHELGLEEETSMWRCDCSVNTVPGSQPKGSWMVTTLIYFGAVLSSKRNQEDELGEMLYFLW